MTIDLFNPFAARAVARQAREAGICVCCLEPPVLRTELEVREYGISAYCGPCWDNLFATTDETE